MDHVYELWQFEGLGTDALGQEFLEDKSDLDLKWYLAGYWDKALPKDVPPSVPRERCSDAISRFPDNHSSNWDAEGHRDRIQDEEVPH